MKGINPGELNLFRKIIFYLGWANVFNVAFWVMILVVNAIEQEKQFWNPKSFEIVYISGWMTLISAIFFVVLIAIAGYYLFSLPWNSFGIF